MTLKPHCPCCENHCYGDNACAYDVGWLACEKAEEESLRRHRTELDRVRGELSYEIGRAGLGGLVNPDPLIKAARKLLAITASRAPLPGEE